ncbi:DNA polymerase III subunit delta [Bacillus cereus]|uniref:DNA polymerase III subunit delta n=1 Tax=Bacillus nitratireducens TaxID=2026193 RepID=UPI0001A108F3|nr:DNA polymerase III subunit delta [Bacillus nitratireducens]EEL86093.1 DNA polymerase III, delta subunit [Bacillus cereus AH1272]EEL91898.1 DNA polymerase III, delta subunit [Bacillus cereus AH1273]EJS59168.1 DNA polymerase III, delta subunit [Bacillus cereus BAG1X1-3]EOO72682.1 DNA polymerase III, delta subunit [Bacillus cereus BAG1O-1]OSY00494.1 DNA polymerase III delta subunit [Bacillus mycoides]PDY25250.1 DNA polymerase III subunit delta [Bacillus cereus]
MSDIHKKIKKKQFAPLYLLYGTEAYFINETIKLITTEALEEEDREFNVVTYDLEEAYLEDVVEDARTLPFFGDRKVILIKSPLFLTAQKEKLEQNIKILEEYIGEPSPFSILVFVAPYEKLDERKKITKLLKKTADVVEANAMQVQDVQKWVVSRAEEAHVYIDNTAVSLLLELVGSNVTMLAKEMDKLTLYVGMGGEITSKLVTELVPKSVEQNVFALTEKVVKKDIAGAMQILDGLFTQQEEPIKLLALLVSQFRLLNQVKELQQRGYGQNQIASHIGVHPYRVKLAMNQTKFFSFEELKRVILELAEADYSMKTGKMDKKLVLEFFLMRLNHL